MLHRAGMDTGYVYSGTVIDREWMMKHVTHNLLRHVLLSKCAAFFRNTGRLRRSHAAEQHHAARRLVHMLCAWYLFRVHRMLGSGADMPLRTVIG
jgi:hypothetical protein